MIMRVYQQAQKSKLLDKVVVATDDKRIFLHCEQNNANVIMTATHHQSGTDRCAEALELIDEHFDIVVNIQGDEPFIQPELISELCQVFLYENVGEAPEIATLVSPLKNIEDSENPNVVKAVFNVNKKALLFSRSPIPFQRNKNEEITYYKHIGLYAFRTEILKKLVKLPVSNLEKIESLEQLRWLENGYEIYVTTTNHETHSIDTPEDLELVKKLYL
ncbi:UNVERIFIED_CONTAM: hypothetical protein GTU68_057964 [Idotea baltica]|nr:hypothetical protein [Idotea baltica]